MVTLAIEEEPKVEKIFEEDEMTLGEVDPSWDAETLLKQECIFFLKDIVQMLSIDANKVKKHYKEAERSGKLAWEDMGVGKTWNHWIIRMKVFAPFYKKQLVPKARRVPKEWDGNQLLRQRGIYFLTDVCEHIPFTTHQIRYQSKKNPRSRTEYGVWKDKELQLFLVDMTRFAKWVKCLWEGNFD